jgi:NCS1 family nucleobase:cation symporter-1
VLPNLPGFLHAVGVVTSVPAICDQLYGFSWFIGFAVGTAVYVLAMARRR